MYIVKIAILPEDGSDMFLRSVGSRTTYYTDYRCENLKSFPYVAE
jgi:hypothetical protein